MFNISEQEGFKTALHETSYILRELHSISTSHDLPLQERLERILSERIRAEEALYVDAQPLSDKFFLVACNPDQPYNDERAWGLYLIDEFGNRVPIHQDPEISCWQPIPLRPRTTPPRRPDK